MGLLMLKINYFNKCLQDWRKKKNHLWLTGYYWWMHIPFHKISSIIQFCNCITKLSIIGTSNFLSKHIKTIQNSFDPTNKFLCLFYYSKHLPGGDDLVKYGDVCHIFGFLLFKLDSEFLHICEEWDYASHHNIKTCQSQHMHQESPDSCTRQTFKNTKQWFAL